MADVLPLKLIDLGSGQGELHEFEAGDVLPPAVVGFIGSPYAAYSGTANAIVLTTAARFPAKIALAVGDQVRFRASSANTGATTINWDGQGAIACRTVTNVALPSGYIRTDVDTVATYDGTYFVLGREIEQGSNANGEYVRWADGTQTCTRRLPTSLWAGTSINTTGAGGGFRSAQLTIAFAADFIAPPVTAVSVTNNLENIAARTYGAFAGSAQLVFHTSTAAATLPSGLTVEFTAIGRWV